MEREFDMSEKEVNVDNVLAKDEVYKLIKDCTNLYMRLVKLYEKLGGNSGEFYDEISIYNDSDLPLSKEDIYG